MGSEISGPFSATPPGYAARGPEGGPRSRGERLGVAVDAEACYRVGDCISVTAPRASAPLCL